MEFRAGAGGAPCRVSGNVRVGTPQSSPVRNSGSGRILLDRLDISRTGADLADSRVRRILVFSAYGAARNSDAAGRAVPGDLASCGGLSPLDAIGVAQG